MMCHGNQTGSGIPGNRSVTVAARQASQKLGLRGIPS